MRILRPLLVRVACLAPLLAGCDRHPADPAPVPVPPRPAPDHEAPRVAIETPGGPQPGPARPFALHGTARDSVGVVRLTYRFDYPARPEERPVEVAPDTAIAFRIDVPDLAEGYNRIVVHAYDSAGNRGSDTIAVFPPLNRAPSAVADTAATAVDAPVVVRVLDNDVDPDDDPLRVTIAAPPVLGSAAVNPDGTITYTPAAGRSYTDRLRYAVSDGRPYSTTATATVSIRVGTPRGRYTARIIPLPEIGSHVRGALQHTAWINGAGAVLLMRGYHVNVFFTEPTYDTPPDRRDSFGWVEGRLGRLGTFRRDQPYYEHELVYGINDDGLVLKSACARRGVGNFGGCAVYSFGVRLVDPGPDGGGQVAFAEVMRDSASPLPAEGGINGTGAVVLGGRMARDGVVTELPPVEGRSWTAVAVNERGEVLGWASLPGRGTVPVLWRGTGTPSVLQVAGDAMPTGWNEAGQVVGLRWDVWWQERDAFLWENGRTVLLPRGGAAKARRPAVNSRGQVVYSTDSPALGYLWEDGRAVPLDSLLADPAWSVTAALAINDRGQIVALGQPRGTQETEVLLLTPAPR